MNKLSITKKELLEEYNKEIDFICEIDEFRVVFSGEEVCGIINSILTKKGVKNSLSDEQLHSKYNVFIENLNLSRDEWVKNYGIPEIIGVIYDILEENN